MKFDNKYFNNFKFTDDQVMANFNNAMNDLKIAMNDHYPDVRFNYSYNSLVKAGIALLSSHNIKMKSVPGHHIKLIETIARMLQDETINAIGNIMRTKRNTDLYDGGIEITEKECDEYSAYAGGVLKKIKLIIEKNRPKIKL